MSYRVLKLLLLTALLSASGLPVFAQEPETPPATDDSSVDAPEDALGRGTPRGSVAGFLAATDALKWEEAAEYLDLRNLPADVRKISGAELARQLHQVMSRIWLDEFTISDKPEGLLGDDLPSYRDELARIPTPDGDVMLWLQRVPRGDDAMIWKVSNRSVALIPELYDYYSYSKYVEKIRKWFPGDLAFLGIEAFKWFILILIALAGWPVFYLLGLILARVFSRPGTDSYPHVRKLFTGPLVLLAILVTVGLTIRELGAGEYARQVMRTNTLMTLAVVWFTWALIDLYRNIKQQRLIANNRPGAAKLLQPMSTLVKILIVLFGLLFWLNNVGVNITTVLAGLGVGGLAVALALQKPIEDLMGALTIFTQASVRVGDMCRFGETIGSIEEIGLRTTRVRTLINSVISVPNSKFAYLELENLTYREKIRYWPTLRLRYDTKRDTIRVICKRILETLQTDPNVHDEPMRVRFTDFDDDAILIKVHAFLDTTDYSQSLEYRERLNLAVMAIVEEEGARFALPGTSIYMEGDTASTSK
jgi:MscS family membrane protein